MKKQLVCALLFGLLFAKGCCESSESKDGLSDLIDSLSSLDSESSGHCRFEQTYEHYYPSVSNLLKTGKIHILVNRTSENLNLDEFRQHCLDECCEKSSTCNYLWLFKDGCYSLDCTNSTQCGLGEKEGLNSVVIKIERGEAVSRTSSAQTSLSSPSPSPSPSSLSPSPSLSSSPSSSPSPSPSKAPTTVPAPQPPTPLSVTTDKESYQIQLPTNSLKVFGSVYPPGLQFEWLWQVVSGPGGGTVEGNTEPTLVLKDLPEGVYHVKVTVSVTGEHKDKYLPGEQHINITVLPAPRENKPPRVVFGTQSNVTLRLPDAKYILSASGTTDDGEGPLKYKWELELKPVGAPNIDPSTGDRMELNNLHEGKYVIKLTVTDSEGASSSKNAFITVLPEKDDPPTADTGESVYQIQLPQDKVVIFANRSKDDHGIKDYNWEIINPKDEDKLININGADTPFLTLSGLRQGSYQFKLTVTDTKGQTDSKMVSVVVNAESFNPPVARAGSNVNVSYPASSVKLNGSTSRDDYKIVAYSWTLLSGPEDVKIEDSDKAIATATNLHIEGTSPTVYTFQLNVTNYRHLSSQSTVNVTVCKESNVPPTADAGPDLVVHLPQHQVVLDGSGSHDDFGIKEFKWNRSSDSPAAGIVEEGSESMAILKLSNVVMGVYRLMLCVTNTKGQSSCDSTVLTVLPASNNLSIVQLVVDQEVTQLTAGSLESLMTGVRLELEMQQLERVDLTVTDVYPLESRTVVEFIVTQEVTHDPLNGSMILEKLEAYLGGGVIRDIPLTKVDTKVCQNPCSGHGTCDQRTKTCKCDIFWMENFVSSNVGAKQSNCEWSVLYFVLIILGIVLIFFFFCWIACCCHIRRRRNKRRKRIKYALLQNQNEEDGRSIKLREKRQHRGQVLMSETDSEDDVLFDKKSNSSETPPPGYNNLGNGKISSKASSLVRGLIPH